MIDFLINNWLELVVVVLIIINLKKIVKFVGNVIAGDDNKVDSKELILLVCLIIMVWVAYKELTNDNYQIDHTFFGIIVGLITAIAGISEGGKRLKQNIDSKTKKNEESKTD